MNIHLDLLTLIDEIAIMVISYIPVAVLSISTITLVDHKHCTVTLSSIKADYMALSDSTKKNNYLSKLLSELLDDIKRYT